MNENGYSMDEQGSGQGQGFGQEGFGAGGLESHEPPRGRSTGDGPDDAGQGGSDGAGDMTDGSDSPVESGSLAAFDSAPAEEPPSVLRPVSGDEDEDGDAGEGDGTDAGGQGEAGDGGASGAGGSAGGAAGEKGGKARGKKPRAGARGRTREIRIDRNVKQSRPAGKRKLVINYTPGEECRVAVVVDGKLDEFHSERFDQVSHVGNIYVGRVTNVEPSIQAAFVDFGLGNNGFLHTSDLHPRYFPGGDGDTTERVGKKIPRRERPPIQECLRRGQEIIVQVLKEGVGSKGPTVTSYLSIPGRYLVMMPGMDRVGVSRKVEDDGLRAKMKEILDALELPEGFGFIVRTAGLDKTKTELKRDLAYLMRLQKDMERRRKGGSKPRLLYSESDLLVRALRDMLTTETEEVIVDSEVALKRAARFMKIVSPRTETRLVRYAGRSPVFHAVGLEEQIRTMYAREVPLPSGGRLVIDETEALVAIDVNSGKSRRAGDSEENAYRTNLEAIEEISRQLRLRDLGGIVINDLIDMRSPKHRKDVEQRFAELLSSDRARATLLPISEFGILEMTRQRMRGSHEQQHFGVCTHCHGRGLLQKADSVAADALRELAGLLDHQRVAKAEMVVHPRIAGELLSGRRKALARLERSFSKPVHIRLSEAIAADRVQFYAYDEQGNDIEIERLPRKRATGEELLQWIDPNPDTDEGELEQELLELERQADQEEPDAGDEPEPHLIEQPAEAGASGDGGNFTLDAPAGGRRRRRGRGRGRGDGPQGGPGGAAGGQGGGQGGGQNGQGGGGRPAAGPQAASPARPADVAGGGAAVGASGAGDSDDGPEDGRGPVQLGPDGQPIAGEGGRRRRRRRRGRRGRGGSGGGEGGAPGAPGAAGSPGGAGAPVNGGGNGGGGRPPIAPGQGQNAGQGAGQGGGQGRGPGQAPRPGGGGGGGPRGQRPAAPSSLAAMFVAEAPTVHAASMGDHGDDVAAPTLQTGAESFAPAGGSDADSGGGTDGPDGPDDIDGPDGGEGGDGAPGGGGGEGGEGGGRKRRRRRRRRGRGGSGGGEGGGPAGAPGAGGAGDGQAPPTAGEQNVNPRSAGQAQGPQGPAAQGQGQRPPQGGGGQGQGDGRRDGGREPSRDRPRDQSRDQGRGGGGPAGGGAGGGAPSGGGAGGGASGGAAAGGAGASPTGDGKPKPRTLYSAFRRLKPGQVPKKRDE